MPNQPANDQPLPCGVCGLLLVDEKHDSAGDCIRGMRAAMLKQRQAAERLSFEVSTRYLAILENLSLNPNVGVEYFMRVPGQPENIVQVHHQQAAGIFTAIWRAFHEAGDWSPLREQEEKILAQRKLIDLLLSLLPELVTPQALRELNRDFFDTLKEIEEVAKRLGVPLPDLRDY